MIDRPPNPVDPSEQVSDASERVRAVAAFLRDQAEREETSHRGEVRTEHLRRFRKGSLAVTWVGIVYAWIATPAWLTVEPIPVQSVVQESESLRVNIWLQSQRIEAYRIARGRLPYVLDEAGPRFRGLEYTRKANQRYEITGRSERAELTYGSRQDASDFLGESAGLLLGPEGRPGADP